MKIIYKRRSFPRKHIPQNSVEQKQNRLHAWVGRVLWFVVGSFVTGLFTILSIGPDDIRKIPEIPKAITETIYSVIEAREIDKGLTGSWGTDSSKLPINFNEPQMRFELTGEDGLILGEIYSPIVRNFHSPTVRNKRWFSRWDSALVEGKVDGAILHLTIFDFVLGKRTSFAELDVHFQEDSDGILDHVPALVDSELRIVTKWQNRNVLPKNFSVYRVAE